LRLAGGGLRAEGSGLRVEGEAGTTAVSAAARNGGAMHETCSGFRAKGLGPRV